MVSAELSVTKSDGSLVVPSEPTPSHTLPLSSTDRISMLGAFVEMFMVYKHGHESAKDIKQALGKALVPYYPLAGRFVSSEQGEVGVKCTGDGVWFIEAQANCSLEDMGWLDEPPLLVIPREQLLPLHPDPAGMTMMMQVTQFTCGGFVVGFMSDHTIADGIGVGQILKAIGEICRGLEQPTVKPIWSRELIPNSKSTTLPKPPSFVPGMHFEWSIIDIPLEQIKQLKDEYNNQTGDQCTAFDVAIAKLWKSRMRAIGLEPDVETRIGFMVNARQLLKNIQTGYYGNCLYYLRITAASGKIADGTLVEIVNIIRDAKSRLPDEFAKWADGAIEEDPFSADVFGYESMVVSDWSRLGFSEVDFGCGGPAYFAPVPPPQQFVLCPMCLIVRPPAPKEGLRLMTICVKEEHLKHFNQGMMNLL